MKPKQMMLFAVAVSCGLVAMIGAQQVLSGNKPAEQEMVKILVAKGDIDPGVPLDKMNVGFKEWPKDNVPEGAITKEEEFVDHALKIRLSTNMPVLLPYLGPKGQVGISSLIPKGMRMVTMPVDSTMTHSGLLRAGSYVTVTCAVSRPPRDNLSRETTSIKTVLKRVKVMAVGDKIAGSEVATKDPNAAKVENVSFVVFPRQANLLNLAKEISKGRMQLALLGEEDKSTDDAQDMDEDALAAARNDLLGEKANELLENQHKSTINVPSESDAPARPKAQGGRFSEYLRQQPVAPEVADLGKRPSKSTWRIEIWNGDKKDIHEIELDDEPIETPVSAPPMGKQLTPPLMRFFTRKKGDPPIEETQNETSEEMSAKAYSEKSAARLPKSVRQ